MQNPAIYFYPEKRVFGRTLPEHTLDTIQARFPPHPLHLPITNNQHSQKQQSNTPQPPIKIQTLQEFLLKYHKWVTKRPIKAPTFNNADIIPLYNSFREVNLGLNTRPCERRDLGYGYGRSA